MCNTAVNVLLPIVYDRKKYYGVLDDNTGEPDSGISAGAIDNSENQVRNKGSGIDMSSYCRALSLI